MVDASMNIDEIRDQVKIAKDVVEYLQILESRIMDLLTSADSLGRTSQYFDGCMSKLEDLHGSVDELKHQWDLIT